MADSNHNGVIGFAGLLTIVFITLKLLNKINWSWLLVLAPIIIYAIILIVLIFISLYLQHRDII